MDWRDDGPDSRARDARGGGAPSLQRVDPDYGGGSILNLVAAFANHFGIRTGHPPTSTHLPLAGVKLVVLFIVDALGYHQLQRHLDAGDLPNLESFLRQGEATTAIATSTFPSTTATALTTFHTGRSPAQHGMVGYTAWVLDPGTVADLILFRDLVADAPLASPQSIMRMPSLYHRLASEGVVCRVVIPRAIEDSPLSQWHFAGADVVPYETPGSIPSRVAEAAEGEGRRYLVVYWPGYDAVCHVNGPSSPEAGDEAAAVDLAFGRLIETLPHTGKTLVVLTADHGQRGLDPSEAVVLSEDGRLRAWLASPPMGERCGRFLRVRPGFEERVARHLTPFADVMPMADAWAIGLFGGPPTDAEFRMRTGDLLAVPRGNRQLHWSFADRDRSVGFRGGHGGWSDAEMLVPVIALRV